MKRIIMATTAIALLAPTASMANTTTADTKVLTAVERFAADVSASDITTHAMAGGKTLAEFTRANVSYQLLVDEKGSVMQVMETQSYRPVQTDPRNQAIGEVASIYEDLTEFALARDRGSADEAVGKIVLGLSSIHPLLDAKAAEKSATNLKAIESSVAAQDWEKAALHAVDGYGLLEETLDASRLLMPIDVSMMDYTGFKLSALASATSVDWTTVSATIEQSAKHWATLEAQVKDKGLRDTLNSIHAGLNTALVEKNASQLAFGAQMELDVVDLLEHYFVTEYKTGVGALPTLDDAK